MRATWAWTTAHTPKKQLMIPLPLLHQREIEARAIAPLFQALLSEIGEVRTREILSQVIREQARQSGVSAAITAGGKDLLHLKQAVAKWCEGGALELTILQDNDRVFEFHVTRCQFAEMYNRLGLSDLGPIMSCGRDAAMIEGFNPDIAFTRTQTIMQGSEFCNFRYEVK